VELFSNHDLGFGITVYFGDRKGSASTSDTRPEAIRETVRAAVNIARFTEADEYNGLADAELMARHFEELDIDHPWALDPAAAETLARDCEAAGLGEDPRITNSDGAQVSTQRACRVYGNSHGFLGSQLGTRHSLSCMLIGEDGKGMQRDYWYSLTRSPDALWAPEAVGREAARRTLARLSPRRVKTGRYPVLFAPPVAGGLVGHLLGAIAGSALYRKASFLLDSLGQQVAAEHLSLIEEPRLPRRMGSANFDSDGVATRSKAFIEAGVVASYVLGSYSARRLGLATTGNAGGIHNLRVAGRTLDAAGLLREMGTGLLVTELMGQGVNAVTGDYSRGASGFWVENGEIAYPVDELTIAGNLKDMYRQLVAIGDDPDLRGNVCAPSLLVEAMTLASA